METQLDLLPGRLQLLVAPRRAARDLITTLSARLALLGPLHILDGGNSLDVYGLARAIRRRSTALDETLGRVRVARAFTCHQMLALLSQAPLTPYPKLALDLLATFYDSSVPAAESRRLLSTALERLRGLSAAAPLLVSARPPPDQQPDRRSLFEELLRAADDTWRIETDALSPQATSPARSLRGRKRAARPADGWIQETLWEDH